MIVSSTPSGGTSGSATARLSARQSNFHVAKTHCKSKNCRICLSILARFNSELSDTHFEYLRSETNGRRTHFIREDTKLISLSFFRRLQFLSVEDYARGTTLA